MQPIKPNVTIEGDTPDKLMSKTGFILGYNRNRVIWVFGFTPDSPLAKLAGVSVADRTYVRAKTDGVVRESFTGKESELPPSFKNILRARIFLMPEPDK